MEVLYKVQTRYLFHTNIKMKIPSEYGDSVLDELFEIMEEVNRKYNSYSEGSYFDRINKNNGNFTDVDMETLCILEEVIRYSDLMKGEYDITIMPLIRLWGFYREKVENIPSPEEINEVKKLVDYRKILVDTEKMKVRIGAGQEIITGSFIKSYAVDKVIEKMKELDIKSAIVNAGGSSIATLSRDSDDLWEIVVESPEIEGKIEKDTKGYPVRIESLRKGSFWEQDALNENLNEISNRDMFDIGISNETYSTSNQINTYLEIKGERYGHIISPKTGYASKNRQIGIITERAFIGDMISTGLYNQTPDEFKRIMEKLQKELKIEGYLMDGTGRIHYSSGFLNYITGLY